MTKTELSTSLALVAALLGGTPLTGPARGEIALLEPRMSMDEQGEVIRKHRVNRKLLDEFHICVAEHATPVPGHQGPQYAERVVKLHCPEEAEAVLSRCLGYRCWQMLVSSAADVLETQERKRRLALEQRR